MAKKKKKSSGGLNTSYLTKMGGHNLIANRSMSFSSISVLTACLLLVGISAIILINIQTLVKDFEKQNVVVAFVKEDIEEPMSVQPAEKINGNKKLLGILGLVISLLGCVSLIVFGAISVFNSKTADKIAQSSMIVIDGTFIAMLISVLFVVFGAIILIKTMKHK